MNIFVLSEDPIIAAQMQCDQHVVKMTLESAQMLSTSYFIRTGIQGPYLPCYLKHPCTLWAAESSSNFSWLLKHGKALSEEYTYRYGKNHKSQNVISWCSERFSEIIFPKSEQTPFVLTMPEKYKTGDTVESYRNFYQDKHFAKWRKTRSAPDWWKHEVIL